MLIGSLLIPEVATICPFCRGRVTFGTKPEPFATHDLPMCPTFERLGAVEFITEVNRKALEEQRKHMS